MTRPDLGAAVEQQRPEPEQKNDPIPNAMATRKRRGKKGLTVYVWPATLEAAKRAAGRRSMTLEELLLSGLNDKLREDGEQGTA